MPLSEFYRMAKGKFEAPQQRTTDVSYIPDDEFVELVWEKGQIMMQGQSSKGRRTPVSSNFQFLTPRLGEKDIASAASSKIGKFGGMDSILNLPSVELGLNQDDDMVPWLNYPLDDNLEHDYCPDLLPEISGVTVNEPSTHNSFTSMDKEGCCDQLHRDSHNVSVHHGAGLDQGDTSKISSSRTSHLFPWSLHQTQISAPSHGSGVSDIVGNNTRNNPHALCGDSTQVQGSSVGFAQMKMQKQDSGLPTSNLLNFSHFSRPAVMARANLQTIGALTDSGSSDVEVVGNHGKSVATTNVPAELTHNSLNCGPQNGMVLYSQSSLVSSKVDSKPLVTKPVEEACAAEQSDNVRREDTLDNDKSPNLAVGASTPKGVPDNEKAIEPIGASSSVCSGNSAERASNDLRKNSKRKSRDTEDFECQSEDVEEDSVGVKKVASGRGSTGSKRSRAAEVHNLSERRRRDRINEKMRALQELIPNCNKVDKASMLDEAIEYLKTLQLQVQIMSMGTGLCMPPMMFSTGMQHMHAAHVPHFSPMGIGMGMGMGMGFGMGMLDVNGGSQGRPMIPLPPMQGQRYPSPISGLTNFQGIPGSNLQVLGHPGPGIPMLFPQGPLAPLSGRPSMNPAVRLNALRTGAHVEVPNAAPRLNTEDLMPGASPHVLRNADASSSMNQTSSQCQTTNEGFDQSGLVSENDKAQDVGGSAAAVLTDPNGRPAGCD